MKYYVAMVKKRLFYNYKLDGFIGQLKKYRGWLPLDGLLEPPKDAGPAVSLNLIYTYNAHINVARPVWIHRNSPSLCSCYNNPHQCFILGE